MALVDYEAVVLDIQEFVRTKKSFGQRELTDFVTDALVRHRQVEGLPEKALRMYGSELQDALTERPSTGGAAGPNGHGRPVAAS